MLENQIQLDPDTQAVVETFAPLERDPEGRAPHEPGSKLDAGKNRLGLILYGFPHALDAVGRVATFGAQKYSPHGWRSVPDGFQRYTDALLRHLIAEGRGELHDADSNLTHAAAVAWNALARLELLLATKSPEPPTNVQKRCMETTDPVFWASEFARCHGGDERLMLGWFTNAMITVHDEMMRRYGDVSDIQPRDGCEDYAHMARDIPRVEA